MLYVLVHGCDPGRVSDSSRLALSQTLSINAFLPSFSGMYVLCAIVLFFLAFRLFCFCYFFVFMLSLELFCGYYSDMFVSSRPRAIQFNFYLLSNFQPMGLNLAILPVITKDLPSALRFTLYCGMVASSRPM